MKTNWAYANNKAMTQEHKDTLELILKSFIQNIDNVKEYHFDAHTDVEEVHTETLWKQFRPGKRHMDLKISAWLDGYCAYENYVNPTEKEKNADTDKEEHISLKPYTLNIKVINAMWMERFASLPEVISRAIDVLFDKTPSYPSCIRKKHSILWKSPQVSETLLSLKAFAEKHGVPWEYHED